MHMEWTVKHTPALFIVIQLFGSYKVTEQKINKQINKSLATALCSGAASQLSGYKRVGEKGKPTLNEFKHLCHLKYDTFKCIAIASLSEGTQGHFRLASMFSDAH